MSPLARIRMFVEMSAVELGEAVSVTREMRGSPIQKDADSGLVAAIHKLHEFRRTAEAARGREVPESLVAPGAVEGMLHDGKQFDVRVAEIFDVGNQLVAEFSIAKPAIMIFEIGRASCRERV